VPPVAPHRSCPTPAPRTIVIAGLFAAVGLSYIGPVSGYLSTKSTLRSQEAALSALQSQRADLAGQLALLKQPQVLEIRAREIGMLRPGEQGYVIDFYSPKPKFGAVHVEVVPARRSGAS
jgi:hypothetical protein